MLNEIFTATGTDRDYSAQLNLSLYVQDLCRWKPIKESR